jgi:hypothetical protein
MMVKRVRNEFLGWQKAELEAGGIGARRLELDVQADVKRAAWHWRDPPRVYSRASQGDVRRSTDSVGFIQVN